MEVSIVGKSIFLLMCMWTKIGPDLFKRNLIWICFSKILVKLYFIVALFLFLFFYIVFNIRTLGTFIRMGITELDLHRGV